MRYDNPDLLRQLAAEYVIGTLQGPARKRFEALEAVNEEARFQREFWEQRLAEFGQVVHPVVPPVSTRQALLRRTIAPVPAMGVVGRSRRRRRALWTYMAGFATAASLMAAFLLGQRHPVSPTPPPAALTLAVDEPVASWPIYAAQVRMPASSMGWLLSVTPDHNRLIAVAADDFVQVGRHRLQLWCLVPGKSPVAIGQLPTERDANVEFAIPASVRGHAQVSFIVTLEPALGSSDNGPAGAVMNEAQSLTEI